MRYIILCLFLLFSYQASFAQVERYDELSERDVNWKEDIPVAVEKFAELRRFLAEFATTERATVLDMLPPQLIHKLSSLDRLYLKEVNKMSNWYAMNITERPQWHQAYSFAFTRSVMDRFLIYPDVYAIFMNPVRKSVNPLIARNTTIEGEGLILALLEGLKGLNEYKLGKIDEMCAEFQEVYPSGPHDIFQGSISDERRELYNRINMLLWLNRSI